MKLNKYLAWQALSQFERKGLFNRRYFWFGEYLGFATSMYETSSVLGYTYSDERFPKLIELVSQEGRVNDLMTHITILATKRISELKKAPNNFYELVFETEAKSIMKNLPPSRSFFKYHVK